MAEKYSSEPQSVRLALLLNRECTQLLDLYVKKEKALMHHTPDSARIVIVKPKTEGDMLSPEKQVQLLHAALHLCQDLLNLVIEKEKESWGQENVEGAYEKLRTIVKSRFENMVATTELLTKGEEGNARDSLIIQDSDCHESAFDLKPWIYRVLAELIHWSDHAVQTLRDFHEKTETVKS